MIEFTIEQLRDLANLWESEGQHERAKRVREIAKRKEAEKREMEKYFANIRA